MSSSSGNNQTLYLRNGGEPVDTKDLISFDLGFNKLGLVLGDIVNRLSNLENNSSDNNRQPNNDETSGSNNNDRSTPSRAPINNLEDLARRLENLENKVDDVSKKQNDAMNKMGRSSIRRPGASNNQDANETREETAAGENNNNEDAEDLFGLLDSLNDKINDLNNEIDEVKGQTKKALSRAGDAQDKADAVGDRLDSHLRFAHGQSQPDENKNGDGETEGENKTRSVINIGDNVSPQQIQQLAEDQHRMQSALDRVAKQGRENSDEIDTLGSQYRALQRQQISTPPSRGGADSMNASVGGYSKPMLDLSKRVSALEEESKNNANNNTRSLRPGQRPSSSPEEDVSGSFQQKLDDALDKIRGQLTSHDVAIEDLQNQSSAMLNNLGGNSSNGDGGVPKDVLTAAVTSLQNRVKNAEENIKDHNQQLQELNNLKNTAADRQQLEELSKNFDYETKATHNMHEKLNDRMSSLESKLKSHLEDPRHVDEKEFERLQDDVRRLEKDLMSLANNNGNAGGDGDNNNKNGMSELASNMINGRLDALQKTVDDLVDKLNDVDGTVKNLNSQLGDSNNNIRQNSSKIASLEGMLRRVADETNHAAHDARTAGEAVDGILKRLSQLGNGQDQLNDRLNQVDHSVTTLAAQSNRGGGSGGQGGQNAGSSKAEEALRADLEKVKKWINARDQMTDPNSIQKNLDSDRENNKSQLVDIRAIIDHIHHTKADSSQVASKADRDYVESALEKLMREVENVINSTNAGLIDTLDKSLGLLRDMIDGKATKQDVAKVRNLIGASEVGGNAAGGVGNNAGNSMNGSSSNNQQSGGDNNPVFDGLMGVYSYRCLGCNRTVEGMRSRPMGSTMSNFMARNAPQGGSSGSGVTNTNAGNASNRAGTPRAGTSTQQPLLIPAPPSSTPK